MANPNVPLPRDVQSNLHDKADEIGEKIAKGTLFTVGFEPSKELEGRAKCTCTRYSLRRDSYLHFWFEEDPNCEYTHLAPHPEPFRVPVK